MSIELKRKYDFTFYDVTYHVEIEDGEDSCWDDIIRITAPERPDYDHWLIMLCPEAMCVETEQDHYDLQIGRNLSWFSYEDRKEVMEPGRIIPCDPNQSIGELAIFWLDEDEYDAERVITDSDDLGDDPYCVEFPCNKTLARFILQEVGCDDLTHFSFWLTNFTNHEEVELVD